MMRSAVRRWLPVAVAACGAPGSAQPGHDERAPRSRAADDGMVAIAAGSYVAGSTAAERATAYDDYRATAGHDAARDQRWFDREDDRHVATAPAFAIDREPVTQGAYAEYVAAGRASPPTMDDATWRRQGFRQDFATEVARFAWSTDQPPAGRDLHPVVLVTWAEADGYCRWRGALRGRSRRLPTAAEYEKAARGDAGRVYPWGDAFDADRLNSAVRGPRDTTPVGSYPGGASPYGVHDLAGNVFEWTATPARDGKRLVKGSAWDDFAGVGRGTSGHGRSPTIRHVIVGFRCAGAA